MDWRWSIRAIPPFWKEWVTSDEVEVVVLDDGSTSIRYGLYGMNHVVDAVDVVDAGTFLGELGDVYGTCGDVRLAVPPVSTCVHFVAYAYCSRDGWIDEISET